MKRIFLTISLSLCVLALAATIDSIPPQFSELPTTHPEIFSEIEHHTNLTAVNTSKGWFEAATLFVAVIAAVFSYITYRSQKKTEQHTVRTNLYSQRNILIDLIRHFYRNAVVTRTIQWKLQRRKFQAYPSEEHMVKLKVPMETIHLDATDENYGAMMDLYLKLRNYNIEVDVAMQHLSSKTIDEDTKSRDLATLMMKPGYLSKQIVKTINDIWKDSTTETITEATQKIEQTGYFNAVSKPSPDQEGYEDYENAKDDFAETFYPVDKEKFFKMFNHDVLNELGLNSQDSEKIHLIAL